MVGYVQPEQRAKDHIAQGSFKAKTKYPGLLKQKQIEILYLLSYDL